MANFNLFGQTITGVDGFSLSDTNGTEHTFDENIVFTVTGGATQEDEYIVSCNASYSECVNAYTNQNKAVVVKRIWSDDYTSIFPVSVTEYYADNYIKYVWIDTDRPGYDITYHSDGTIDFVDPSIRLKTLTATTNGTYIPSDGVYVQVDVNVPSGTPTLQTKTVTPTTSQQSVTPDTGYDGLSSVTVNAMPNGSMGTPTATKGSVSNHSISVTPSVTNTQGYIAGGTVSGTAVTVSASELVSGSETKTANGTYDVTNLASLVVNVSGGGGSGGLTLLKTTSLGSINVLGTSVTNLNMSVTLEPSTNFTNYDLLILDISVDTTPANGYHTSTVSLIYVTGNTNVSTKNSLSIASQKWNSKISSSGVPQTRANGTSYGIYASTASVTSTITINLYSRRSNSDTGTINGNYTARVYGVKLYDLIGG